MNVQRQQQVAPDNAPFTPVPSGFSRRTCACGTYASGGECVRCTQKKLFLQRAIQNSELKTGDSQSVPSIVHEIVRSSGQPVDASPAFFETRFGRDFSRVRVYRDQKPAESVGGSGAFAYAVGPAVVFEAGLDAARAKEDKRFLAHERVHTIRQHGRPSFRLMVADTLAPTRKADAALTSIHSAGLLPGLKPLRSGAVARQKLEPDEPLHIERNFELDPELFVKPMETTAEREAEKCEEFPGGATDCEVDASGTPTGKVKQRVDETNLCTAPCVQQHEAVHVKQMKTLCPKIRDCYLAADKGKRSALECARMAIFGNAERECEAYKVSVPCVEKRLKSARECQSNKNKEYGTRKLASEKCFRDKYCGSPGS